MRSQSLLWLSVLIATASPRAQGPVVDLSLEVPSSVTLHEPLVVSAVFHNRGNAPVSLDVGANFVGHFKMGLRTPDGQVVAAHPGHFIGDVGFTVGRRDVPPNGQAHQEILLNQWFDLSREGLASIDNPIVASFLGKLIEPGKRIELWSVEHTAMMALERMGEFGVLCDVRDRANHEERLAIDRVLERMERKRQ